MGPIVHLGCTCPALQGISNPHTTMFLSRAQPGHRSLQPQQLERSQQHQVPHVLPGLSIPAGMELAEEQPNSREHPGGRKEAAKGQGTHRIIPGHAPLCPQAQHCFHLGPHEAHLTQTSHTRDLGWEPEGASTAGSMAERTLPRQDRLWVPAGQAPAESIRAAGDQSSARQCPPRGRWRQPGPTRQTVTQQLSQG